MQLCNDTLISGRKQPQSFIFLAFLLVPSYYLLPIDEHKRCLKGYVLTRCLHGRLVVSQSELISQLPFRSDVKWCQPSEMEMTSEMNWQLSDCTCISTIWDPVSIPSISYMVTFVMYYYLLSFLIYTCSIYICIREVGQARNVFSLSLSLFLFAHAAWLLGSYFPTQGLNLGPQQ